MKKDATQRATTEIANSWSAHSTINHVRSPDTSPLVRAAAGVRGQCPGEHLDCVRRVVQGKEDSAHIEHGGACNTLQHPLCHR